MSTTQDIPEEICILPDTSSKNILVHSSSKSENNNLPTVSYVQSKIVEFSSLFNSTYRLTLLNCEPSERQHLIYVLISLKKNVKLALEELGKSLRNHQYQFRCGLCDKEIVISKNEDIWSSLQNHEHFEELYYQFLNNELEFSAIAEEATTSTSESESNIVIEDTATAGDSNTDSGIEQHEMEPSTSGVSQITSTSSNNVSPSDENVNSFRFNFNITYDEYVEGKIYPPSIMLGIRKYDKVKEFTIMRAGYNKAACLICHCEMNNMRITKNMLVNHAMGQKHLKAAGDTLTVKVLKVFHDFWLKQEPALQAHSVYFRPLHLPSSMRCALCGQSMLCDNVIPHILSDIHRNKVLEMYEKRSNLYLMVNLQVQVYGITEEQVEARENEIKLKEKVEQDKQKRSSKTSESDTAEETKKLPSNPQSIDHKIIKSVENPDSTDCCDLLPNRMKGAVSFFKRMQRANGIAIRCDHCKCDLQDNVGSLKNHIISSHELLKQYKYYCEICNIKVNNEKDWMAHNFSGPRHVNMALSRKANVMEYECTTCKTVIFGDELSLKRHLAVGNRANRRDHERGTRLPEHIKKLFKSTSHILGEADLLTIDAQCVLTNSLTQDCCNRLESALLEIFENCKVYPFGSRISGIGNKASDLDVFVDVGGSYYAEKNQEPKDQVLLIRKAVKAFFKKKEYANIVNILAARTPILKLHHVPTKLDCDLSFKHGLSVENTKFLKFCLELQPVCQKLILLIKKWAWYIGFESISTYALAMLCIFYLQVTEYLPSVKKLREINNGEHQVISGWQTINYSLSVLDTKPHVRSYEKTICDLLQEFFTYYSKFDFNSYVVCPLLGRVVKKSLFTEGSPEDLPSEMGAYVAQLEGADPELFRSRSYMCIQDPFDLSHNLTKAAQQGTLTKFQGMCKLSLAHIEALK